ncbi:MAG: hypothetical protein QHC65_06415 [Sphingomonas sp.]|nr:hypothetical protein [Sphingomonas sp.]MDX3884036.1 hypothetical protein [Sphingomonas sp.]
MADNITTPVGTATVLATKEISGAHASKIVVVDQAGGDVVGQAVESPAAFSIAGRLKAIADKLLETIAVSATALPLPAGAATAAKQDEAAAAIQALAPSAAPFAITPHATNALERQIKAISVVTGGDITFRYPGETSDRTIPVPAGFYPLVATHIRATTTATGLTGW